MRGGWLSLGHAASSSPKGLGEQLSFSAEVANDLAKPSCCLTDSWSERRPVACFWAAASKNILVAVMELFSLESGSLNLSIILSMIKSDTVVDNISSAWARRRKATEWMAVQASAGSLKASEAENKISASLKLVLSSLFNSHPLFSSQERASLADETGLGAARTCTSRSARGENFGGFGLTWCFDHNWRCGKLFGTHFFASRCY